MQSGRKWMDEHEIQNLSALVEVTKGADYSTGKLFDEADCDGKPPPF
jgi:hypothetical protein